MATTEIKYQTDFYSAEKYQYETKFEHWMFSKCRYNTKKIPRNLGQKYQIPICFWYFLGIPNYWLPIDITTAYYAAGRAVQWRVYGEHRDMFPPRRPHERKAPWSVGCTCYTKRRICLASVLIHESITILPHKTPTIKNWGGLPPAKNVFICPRRFKVWGRHGVG